MPTLAPASPDIGNSPTLENLYKDLDLYMKELDKEVAAAAAAAAASPPAASAAIATGPKVNRQHTAKQPSFSFKIAGVIMDDMDGVSSNSSTTTATTATTTQMSSSEDQCHHDKDRPSIALLSELSRQFVQRVNVLVASRNIFCSTEYPKSFTGEEAVNILISIIGHDWSRKEYRNLARLMMQMETPALFSPIAYSDKSLKNNTLYDSSKEAYTLNELAENEALAQSLIMPLMDCYTPHCVKGASTGCYAPTCPNRGLQLLMKSKIINKELQRNISLTSSMASSQDTLVSRCWSNTVSRETLQKTPAKEMKRQEAIYELIYTEEDYVRDLNLLDELFAKPLLRAQCIEFDRRRDFCNELFGNYAEIADIHRNMYRELRDHQLTSQEIGGNIGFVDEIGSIVLRHVDQFMHAYTQYGPHFIMAEYTAKREAANNILFHNFIREKEKQAETRKLPFRHFIILPITRLQRYPLLLDAILKRTTIESERQTLTQCIDLIKAVAATVDNLTVEAKKVLRIREINDKILFKPNHTPYNLELLNPGRQLIYEGPLKRRSHLVVESIDLHVFLFDHLLLMTKPKKSGSSTTTVEHYVVSKNPIPLNLLVVNDVAENFIFSTFRSNSTTKGTCASVSSLIPTTTASSSSSPLTPVSTPLSEASASEAALTPNSKYINQSSLNIRHLGRHGGEYILYTETPSSRLIWKQKIIRAQADLVIKQEPDNAFKVSTISDTKFALTGSVNNYGKVTCIAPFVGSTGAKMVVLGTQQGIWMGKEGDTNGLTRVLMVNDVAQIGVLEAQNILLVLADKVLTAYPLVQLDPTSPSCISTSSTKGTVSFRVLTSHVSFFNSGTCNGRTLVVTMKRKGPDSHFKAYEPICGDLNESRNAKYLVTKKSSFMSKPPPAWFKIYKEFYIGTVSVAVHFLKSKVLVACSRGFEVIDLDHLSEVKPNLPDLEHRDFNFVATSDAKPLNMFKCKDSFLMCYDQFAFSITTHGDYVKRFKRIDWEGHPHAVAYHYPYVLAFDHRFIEIRHVETGKLVQVVVGDNTRLLTSSFSNTNTTAPEIFGLITHPFRTEYQHIFKLEPLFSS